MLDLQTKSAKGEWFIIPGIGFLKCVKYKEIHKQRTEWRLCFAWLRWRASIRIWREKEWRVFEH